MSRCRDIRQIHVARFCISIPAKHRIDGLTELGAARLVDAAGVHPAVFETIAQSLLVAELDLSVLLCGNSEAYPTMARLSKSPRPGSTLPFRSP
jgi:hypothetical protein